MIEGKTNGITISKEMLAHLTDPDMYVVKPAKIMQEEPFLTNGNEVMAGNTAEIPFLLEGILQRTGLACLAGSSDMERAACCASLLLLLLPTRAPSSATGSTRCTTAPFM